jgi:hypothetical protein
MLTDYIAHTLTKFKKQKYENKRKDSHSIHMRIRRHQSKRRIDGDFNA